jgi:hypothetical protein
VHPEDNVLVISDRTHANCVSLPRKLLDNTQFDFLDWYERAVNEPAPSLNMYDLLDVTDSEPELVPLSASSREMPSLRTVSDTESEKSGAHSSMLTLKSVSDSEDGSIEHA